MSNNVIIYLNQKIFIWGESLFHQVLLVLFVKNIHLLAFHKIRNLPVLMQMVHVISVKVNAALPVEKNGSGRETLIQVTWVGGTQKWIVIILLKIIMMDNAQMVPYCKKEWQIQIMAQKKAMLITLWNY